jgi:hypothetical protein
MTENGIAKPEPCDFGVGVEVSILDWEHHSQPGKNYRIRSIEYEVKR